MAKTYDKDKYQLIGTETFEDFERVSNIILNNDYSWSGEKELYNVFGKRTIVVVPQDEENLKFTWRSGVPEEDVKSPKSVYLADVMSKVISAFSEADYEDAEEEVISIPLNNINDLFAVPDDSNDTDDFDHEDLSGVDDPTDEVDDYSELEGLDGAREEVEKEVEDYLNELDYDTYLDLLKLSKTDNVLKEIARLYISNDYPLLKKNLKDNPENSDVVLYILATTDLS